MRSGWRRQSRQPAERSELVRASAAALAAAGGDDRVLAEHIAVLRRELPRLPADHPDALPQTAPADLDTPVPILRSVHDVQVVVAGAPNAGVSSIVETFGAVGRPPSVAKVEEQQ